ncbi:peptide ABC transporter substrate-binding protein [Lactobacillus sp. CC-MHH1034]|uniref:peptide ABC transporter substrate-binding protein n=1 Tax=Agrilactobacillus fermenti TaxID=2586909 RepID=UPI001E4250EA|nr:peptide ABC transporter substrate-binding protein [Agrilactobacillus fermenti]MCD2256088.1 peptide ABC transporter substrate-binding protein [Agrilactobacillus fermenti]
MKLKKVLGAGLVIAASAFLLAACGSNSSSSSSSSASNSKTFTRMEGDTIQTMDPSTNTDAISGQALIDTMDGFYRYNGKKLQPAIATSVAEPTNDGKTYTIKLRKDAKWANGDPVTAKDFVYGWRRTVDPKTASQYAYLYNQVENAQDIQSGKKSPDTLGIKALDDHTVEITLSEAVPYFNGLMTNPAFFPQNQKFVEKMGKKYGTSAKYALSNGPFILKGWTGTNNSWTESKNKDYWNAKAVKLNAVKVQVVKDPSTSLNLYQSGKLNDAILSGENAQQMKNDPAFTPRKQSSVFFVEMNQKTIPAFKNEKIRQAISMSINRKELVNKVLGNGSLAADNVTPQGLMDDPTTGKDFAKEAASKDSQYTTYNPKKAKQLFKEGLQEVGAKNVNVTLLGDDTDNAKKMNEYLQSTWQDNLPGLKVTLQNVPFKTRLTRSQNGQFDMVVSAWGADYPDPISFLDLFTTDNSYNNGKWSNSQYDQLVQDSKTTDVLNKEKRWDDLMQAQNIITEQQGVVPLYQRVEAHLVNKKVKNLQYSPANNYNFVTTYIKN